MSVSAERIAAQSEVLSIQMSLAIEATKRPPQPEKLEALQERVKELSGKIKEMGGIDMYA